MKLTDEVLQYLSGSMDELGQKILDAVEEELFKESIACQIIDRKELDPALVLKDPNTHDMYIMETTTQNKGKQGVSPVLDLNGAPTGQFLEAPERYVIPIGKFSSSRYWRNVSVMKVDPPWTGRAIADMVKNGIAGSIDGRFMELVQASVEATGQTAQCPDLTPPRTTVISAMQSVMGNSYASKLLIRKDDFLAMLKLSESAEIDLEIDAGTESLLGIGNDITHEAWVIENVLNQNFTARCEGMKVVLCDNDDLVKPYHMYVFAMPEDIGKLYLGDTRVEMEKRFQQLQWEGSSTGGMNIADVFSIAEIVVNQPSQEKVPAEKPIKEATEGTICIDKEERIYKIKLGEETVLVKDCRNDVTEVKKPGFWKKLFNCKGESV